ncbi:uncharacterized protein CELE_F12E12.2 [Caenorhabditis elegans]|uniref:Uncharacterized protein n=1 Tax=Caenorhabditis elegans TaxID=6239 RepID=Q9BLC0_CAEEL|nr:Uncharacterized protein CELE_F12E12.2 [Caenorhabditis elegans]CCD67480.1 Uncharacterized protein CELE_F12E12.2 [Caenorhabditis elegans]|eukprot:NP_494638.1 Uncharacterized protein CELE_F12E12.2 [Caenorhabditis elegans]
MSISAISLLSQPAWEVMVQDFWKRAFGDLVPMTLLEQKVAYFTICRYACGDSSAILTVPFFPTVPVMKVGDDLPEIDVPSSAFIYFKSEYAKRSPPNPINRIRNGQQRAGDPHTLAWQALLPVQKEMWITCFQKRKKQAETLILAGWYKKKPSGYQLRRERRMAAYRRF